jgi:hypothetical protein
MIISDEKYLIGLLNSSIFEFYYSNLVAKIRGGYMRFFTQYLEQVPIRAINFDDAAEKAAHDKMVSLVEQMLDAKKHSQAARTDRDKTFYQDRCNALDRQIDKLVYRLYELNDKEITIVEGK